MPTPPIDPALSALLPAPGVCHATAMRKAMRRVSQLYDTALAPSGLRSTQRSLLIHIARAGSPSMSELAGALVLDRTALAHNLKPLERDALVSILVDSADRRSRRVTLTAQGRCKLAETDVLWKQAQAQFEQLLGAEQAGALRAALIQVAGKVC